MTTPKDEAVRLHSWRGIATGYRFFVEDTPGDLFDEGYSRYIAYPLTSDPARRVEELERALVAYRDAVDAREAVPTRTTHDGWTVAEDGHEAEYAHLLTVESNAYLALTTLVKDARP